MGRYSGKTCRLVVMFSLTLIFFLVEIIFGYLTESMALVADSFHMLSDVLALVIAFFCMRISKQQACSKNTFGWIRAEVLGALINAVFLIALCFSVFIESIKRLIKPTSIKDPDRILIVGILGLVVNIIGIFMFHGHASLHGHSHGGASKRTGENGSISPENGDLANETGSSSTKKGEYQRFLTPQSPTVEQDEQQAAEDEEAEANEQLSPMVSEAHNISFFNAGSQQSPSKMSPTSKGSQKAGSKPGGQLNMHGVFLHILGDALGSVIVIINALICWLTDNKALKIYLDPSLSLVMTGIILCTTIPLFKESALILLQTVPTHIDVQTMKQKLLTSVDGVLAVHEFHIWRLAGNKIIATAHIRCRNLNDYMKIAERVKQFFHNEGIHSTTIQPEFVEMLAPNVEQCVLECPPEAQCAPSMCCSVASAAKLAVMSDSDKPETAIRNVDETTALAAEFAVANIGAGTPSSNVSESNASSEEQFQGVPPILYHNAGADSQK